MSWTWQYGLVAPLLVAGLLFGYRLRAQRGEGGASAPFTSWLLLPLFLTMAVYLYQLQTLHRQRIDFVHDEADAIGNCYRYTVLFSDVDRRWFRSQLIAYLELKLSEPAVRPHFEDPLEGKLNPLEREMVARVAKAELGEVGGQLRTDMLRNFSRMISCHYRTRYAMSERLAPANWVFLTVMAILCAFVVGWNCAETKSARAPMVLYLVLVLVCLAVLHDLDNPHGGWIQVPMDNLADLRGAFLRDPM